MAEQTRLAYLEAMGIQAWAARLQAPHAGSREQAPSVGPEATETSGPILEGLAAPAIDTQELTAPTITPPPLGIDTSLPDAIPLPTPPTMLQPICGWDELQAQVAACTACPLHQTRTQTVFGVGDHDADWMVIGEAPGQQEDLQGEPFVGPAGLLLNEMLRAIGLSREKVFIANILKCRPPKNRDPQPDEAAACENYLRQQMALVRPKIILAVGRIAAQNLLKTATPIGKLRGRRHDYQGVPLVVTYHPAYLLRSPLEKRNAFEDLRLALQTYRQSKP